MKKCSKCHVEKPSEMFTKSKSTSSGLSCQCKQCKAGIDKKYREANHEKKKEADRRYYAANSDKIRRRAKDWYDTNTERVTEYKRNYFQENKDAIYEYRKEYKQENGKQINSYMNEYMKSRYKNDLNYRIKSICNKRLRDYIRNKTKQTMDYVGCDVDFLRLWLEFLFVEGMTWDNMGSVWHIDHVRPCNSFDFNNEEEIYDCYHWSNLQPLFARDNISKNDNVDLKMINEQQILADYFSTSMAYQAL